MDNTQTQALVCISASETNTAVIHAACDAVRESGAELTALFVEPTDFDKHPTAVRQQAEENLQLAEKLGARTEVIVGDDPAGAIIDYIRVHAIDLCIVGRSRRRKSRLRKPDLPQRLLDACPKLSILIISEETPRAYPKKVRLPKKAALLSDIAKSSAAFLCATAFGFLFRRLGIHDSNTITLYILTVLIISVITSSWIYGVAASVCCVIIFNFFFTPPVYSFHAYDAGYLVTFAVMFLAAFISGMLANRLKQYAEQAAKRAFRTRILFDTDQLLQQVDDPDKLLDVTGRQLVRLLDEVVSVYPVLDDHLGTSRLLRPEHSTESIILNESDSAAAEWAFQSRKRSGAGTKAYPGASFLYLAIRTRKDVYGVVGLHIHPETLDPFTYDTCLSIIGEAALVMESVRNAQEKEDANVRAKNEELRANLLRMLSHDLRTPLTSISGNASNLLSGEASLDAATRNGIYQDIYDDSIWLIQMVENLLAITRLDHENEKGVLSRSMELLDDIIDEAIQHLDPRISEHTLHVKHSCDLLLVKVDTRLIIQVIVNLVNNAIKYSGKDSCIEITTKKVGNTAVTVISDNGPGLSDDARAHIFEMFHAGSDKVADSRRSLGLGLALCRSIIEAHDGSIQMRDCRPHGAEFSFSLPLEEVDIHE